MSNLETYVTGIATLPALVARRDGEYDTNNLLDSVEAIGEGQCLRLAVPKNERERFRSSVSQAADRRGYRVRFKAWDGDWLLYRSTASRKSLRKERDEQILKLISERCTYEEIATNFGLTRQRIEQIALREGVSVRKTNNLPVALRRDASLAEAAPYIANATTRTCMLCRGERPERTRFCATCSKLIEVVRTVKTQLAHRDEHPQYLRQALHLIRKHKLQPDDLRIL